MATRLFGLSPGQGTRSTNEIVGSPTVANAVEVTVDLAALVNDSTGVRGIKREEVVIALDNIRDYILQRPWPPA